jgi:ATPase subunit of ABC transporter with duplicated ATPase domains
VVEYERIETTGVIMLSIHNLDKNYGVQPILKNINFNISAGGRIGLIGANGSGKTTLIRILARSEIPDSGIVSTTRSGLRIGYLSQGMDFVPESAIRDALQLNSKASIDPTFEIESLARTV